MISISNCTPNCRQVSYPNCQREDTGDTLYEYDPKQINSHTIKYEGAAGVRLVKN